MSTETVQYDQAAEEAVLGAVMLLGEPRRVAGLIARGLRPQHFYRPDYGAVFAAFVSLSDREGAIDPITVHAELERLGVRRRVERERLDGLMADVPSASNVGAYADRVIELARWRDRQRAVHEMGAAVARRDAEAWSRAHADLDSATAGTRTESYSPEAWGSLVFDFLAASAEEAKAYAVEMPWARLTDALGGGLWRGEVLALSGPTSHGKTVVADQWLDHAARGGLRCHLYMTEMTAVTRGMRLLARRTGVPFMRQRRRTDLTDADRRKLIAELSRFDYGCTVAAGWDIRDIVRDALRARYDFVVIDLLHGFHYEDERGLDRLSKGVQELARVSTTINGHPGTAVCAVTHLKEEGLSKGKIPRPTIASIKGGSSIKQDADFVAFVWQEQDEAAATTGDGEIWLAKGRSGGLEKIEVRLNPTRFRFDLRAENLPGCTPSTPGVSF